MTDYETIEVTHENGEPTGNRPGGVIRGRR